MEAAVRDVAVAGEPVVVPDGRRTRPSGGEGARVPLPPSDVGVHAPARPVKTHAPAPRRGRHGVAAPASPADDGDAGGGLSDRRGRPVRPFGVGQGRLARHAVPHAVPAGVGSAVGPEAPRHDGGRVTHPDADERLRGMDPGTTPAESPGGDVEPTDALESPPVLPGRDDAGAPAGHPQVPRVLAWGARCAVPPTAAGVDTGAPGVPGAPGDEAARPTPHDTRPLPGHLVALGVRPAGQSPADDGRPLLLDVAAPDVDRRVVAVPVACPHVVPVAAHPRPGREGPQEASVSDAGAGRRGPALVLHRGFWGPWDRTGVQQRFTPNRLRADGLLGSRGEAGPTGTPRTTQLFGGRVPREGGRKGFV